MSKIVFNIFQKYQNVEKIAYSQSLKTYIYLVPLAMMFDFFVMNLCQKILLFYHVT